MLSKSGIKRWFWMALICLQAIKNFLLPKDYATNFTANSTNRLSGILPAGWKPAFRGQGPLAQALQDWRSMSMATPWPTPMQRLTRA